MGFTAPMNSQWKSGKFLSLRTIALWASNGQVDIYYIGDKNDLFVAMGSDVDQIALISDGNRVICSQKLSIGPFATYRYEYVTKGKSG